MSEPGAGHDDDTLATSDQPHDTRERGGVAAELIRGEVVGRYVVLSKLGAGGMGVVYAAYDPELDRKVALKLLITAADGSVQSPSTEHHTRLLREAQALAKLNHPNVVTIHDVGTHAERVFIAMEFVEGHTLGQWQQECPRSWLETLHTMVLAGRGVAAAHAAHLLHRDLKPDNIMVARDGRVRVMDFGVARAERDTATPISAEEPAGTPKVEALALAITRAGALVGTPAYMAPEQLAGATIGPATDQFSFCVTSWEALFGTRPFVGDSMFELATALLEGGRPVIPARTAVPSWVRRVLERGLARDPDERWPSMDALLDALERGQAGVRRRRGVALTGIAGVSIVAFLGWQGIDRHQRVVACREAGATVEALWSASRGDEIEAAFAATGISYAPGTWTLARPRLNDWVEEWRSLRTTVCERAAVEGTWQPEMEEAAGICLDHQRETVAALLERLGAPDATVIQYAATASASLPRLAECTDELWLRRQGDVPADPDARERRTTLRGQLARASAAQSTGHYDDALREAEGALAGAEDLASAPLVIEAQLAIGDAEQSLGHYESARSAFELAYFGAGGTARDDLALEAATSLAATVGASLARREEGLHWTRLARMHVERMGAPRTLAAARLLRVTGAIEMARGEYAPALQHYERALEIAEESVGVEHPVYAVALDNLGFLHSRRGELEPAQTIFEESLRIREAAFGPDHPDVASTLDNLGVTFAQRGERERAFALLERALHIREQALGRDHPELEKSLNNLGLLLEQRGEHDEAIAHYERALAIKQTAVGAEHPDVARLLNNLGIAYGMSGELAKAVEVHERALAIREKVLGPEHQDVASSLTNLGIVLEERGEHARALALYQRAAAIVEAALGPEHPSLAAALDNMGNVHRRRGELEQASSAYQRAREILEKVVGPEHPDLGPLLYNLGEVQRERGQHGQAAASYERAEAIFAAQRGAPLSLAACRFGLAQALWPNPTDRTRALASARSARDTLSALGPDGTTPLAEVDAWLTAHR